MASKAIRGKNIDAFYSVRMPDTWTPIFDLSTPEKVAFSKTTEAEIDDAIRKISERHTNRHMTPHVPTFLAEWFAQPIYNNDKRRTAHFRVEESCIGCGLCAKNVPFRPSRCKRRSRYGSKRSAPCALAACIAAPSLPFSTERTPNGTVSIRIRM